MEKGGIALGCEREIRASETFRYRRPTLLLLLLHTLHLTLTSQAQQLHRQDQSQLVKPIHGGVNGESVVNDYSANPNTCETTPMDLKTISFAPAIDSPKNIMANPKLKLLDMLRQGQPVMSTFMALKGMRLAQIVANTGLDVSISNIKVHYTTDPHLRLLS